MSRIRLILLMTLAVLMIFAARPVSAREAAEISPLDTSVFGRNTMLWRAPSAVRVIVLDHRTGRPASARVSLWITATNKKASDERIEVYSGRTNRQGTIDASFKTDTAQPGAHLLEVDVSSRLGKDTVVEPLEIDQHSQLLLTSDKPVYQPGQVIHMRTLARDSGTGFPLADAPVTFEVEDARGNKVFKTHQTLSKFGVASADFQLADEVNMGTFTLRVLTGSDQSEKKVQVSRYVLPKFKVGIQTDKPFYLPGETVACTVKAGYFFGKPLAGATVHLTLSTIDIGVTTLAEADAVMDDSGTVTHSFPLPDSFVGQPFEQGKAQIEVAAEVTDTANQKQEGNVDIPVVESPVVLALVPESRVLVPGVENRVFIAAATPDGRPLSNIQVRATIVGGDQNSTSATDDMGLQTFSFVPSGRSATVLVTAADSRGRMGSDQVTINSAPDREGLILRTDRTLAKVGDKLRLDAVSTGKSGTLYIDVIKDKQTILTQSTPMAGGQASLELPVTPDMEGTIELHAYKILPNEDIIRDTRVVLVSPADDLSVTITPNKATYRPGEDATVDFSVRDSSGAGIPTALGVAIVDESVFALSEMKPGLEKVYFMLEKELMEPKYEIHGLTPEGLIELPPPPVPRVWAERQRAAAMLLADAPATSEFDYHTSSFAPRYLAFVNKTVLAEMENSYGKILDALEKYKKDNGAPLPLNASLFALVDKGYLNVDVLKDHWGNFYRTNDHDGMTYRQGFSLNSAGLDGKWDTSDDIRGFTAYEESWRGTTATVISQGTFASEDGHIRFESNMNIGFGLVGGGGVRPLGFAARAGAIQFGDVVNADAFEAPRPAPMPAPMIVGAAAPIETYSTSGTTTIVDGAFIPAPAPAPAAPPRLRQYFPETMYWNPALITDDNGRAQIKIPMADSITTWRVSTIADSETGLLGSGSAPIRVFQDFFVDMDLPVTMTQDDHVDLPVIVYNYLPHSQDVTLRLVNEPWFTLEGDATQVVHMSANDVRSVSFPITVRTIGHHTLTVTAIGSSLSDAVQRPINVVPDGKEIDTVINDQIEGTASRTITIPANAITDATSIWVKLYPGAFSQVVDGLDGMLRMPNGCFEQTSSTTYPNVLILDYLKQTKKINPEMQMTAEQYINIGYQRLVTFECKNGGFSWFGDEPANQILTAYGLLEFSDMSRVHDVDPALITRTSQWLAGRQRGDGSWIEENQGIAEGIINRQTGALRTTAYVGWALSEAGYKGGAIQSALAYVKGHISESMDPYTLAVILNFLESAEPHGDAIDSVINSLVDSAKVEGKVAYWKSDTQTFTGARDEGADLETTGLAAYGLCRSERQASFTTKVLTYLVQSKGSFGEWGSTQGTVWSLKALLWAGQHSGSGQAGQVAIRANGQLLKTFDITADDSNVMRQVELGSLAKDGANTIDITYKGDGAPLYQIVGRYFIPWSDFQALPDQLAPISIDVAYDKTTLSEDDTAGVTVTIKNRTDERAEMPLIDLGIPPGFTVITDGLDAAKDAATIDKYTLTGRQIIVYMQKLDPNQTITLKYSLKAKYPIKAKTPLSKVYPYYNPEQASVSKPQEIVVN